jgi:hemerythrin superfamily protein
MPTRKRGNGSGNGRSNGGRRAAARSRSAVAMLMADHKRVKLLFRQFEKTRRTAAKQELATTICEELKIHAQLEEELFYPAARAAIRDSELLNEAAVEHASAKGMIREIENASPDDQMFAALVTVLGEYINHHVREEESELFPKVRRSKLDLNELGEQMMQRKLELGGGPAAKPGKRLGGLRGMLQLGA